MACRGSGAVWVLVRRTLRRPSVDDGEFPLHGEMNREFRQLWPRNDRFASKSCRKSGACGQIPVVNPTGNLADLIGKEIVKTEFGVSARVAARARYEKPPKENYEDIH